MSNLRVFCFLLSSGLLIADISASAGDITGATFDEDLIFWGLKNRGLFSHKTLALYSRPHDLNSGNSSLFRNTLFESPLNGEIWAIAADYHARKLYYTDHSTNFIGVYDLKTRQHRRVFEGMAWGIDGLAVDWVSGNVYWTDTNYNWIMVANRNFTNYRNLVQIDSKIPAKIAVDPNNRYIYWSESRQENCRLLRSDLHGYKREVLLVLTKTQTIIDMTIDFVSNRLYWAERSKEMLGIGRVRYTDLATIGPHSTVHSIYDAKYAYFFGLASYKDHIYVTNYFGRQLIVLSKSKKQRALVYRFNLTMVPRGITVYSGYEHPLTRIDELHKCQRSPCQHLCLAKPGSNQYECECRIGFSLQSDGRTCLSVMTTEDFAFVLDSTHSKIFQMNLKHDFAPQEVPLLHLENPVAAAYYWRTRKVFWSDKKTRTISSASIHGHDQKVLIRNSRANSIVLDQSSGNMYWIDSEIDAIYVSRMDGSFVHTLHRDQLYTVYGMTIDTLKGYLYWCDWGQRAADGSLTGGIMSSRLDGSDVRVVANPGGAPYDLALDPKNGILFWTQLHDHSIEWVDLGNHTRGKYALPYGELQLPLQMIMLSPTRISYWQDHLYLVILEKKHVLRVAVRNVLRPSNRYQHAAQVQRFGPAMFYRPTGIYTFDSALVSSKLEIAVCANSTCPHLCLPHYAGKKVRPKCVCRDHFKYVTSNNSCVGDITHDNATPPTFGNTCPSSQRVIADECSEEAEVSFVEPTATDDSGLPVTLKRSTVVRQMPMRLKEGRFPFSYTAFDKRGNQAKCQFRIDVIVRRCQRKPFRSVKSIPSDAVFSKPSCGRIVGSIVNVSCPGFFGVAFQYQCQANQVWTPLGPESCGTQATATEIDGVTTDDEDVTFQPTSTNSERVAMTSLGFSARNLVERVTMTSLAISARNLVQVTSTPGRTLSPLSTQSNTKHANLQGLSGKSGGSHSSGLIVGIVIALVISIAISAAFVVLYMRRRSEPFTSSTNWNRLDDRVQLTGTSTESGIYLGEDDLVENFVTLDGELTL